jgi:hypothetical protein
LLFGSEELYTLRPCSLTVFFIVDLACRAAIRFEAAIASAFSDWPEKSFCSYIRFAFDFRLKANKGPRECPRNRYEKKFLFSNSSRHRGHTLSDNQHCPGYSRALCDEIAIGESCLGINGQPNRIASRLGRHSHRDRSCEWGKHMR